MEFFNESLPEEVQSLRTLHPHEQAESCYGQHAFTMVAEHKIEIERSETAKLWQPAEQLEELLTETRCAVAPEYVAQRCALQFAECLSELEAKFVADHQALLCMQETEDIFMLLGIAEHSPYRKVQATCLLGEARDEEVLGIFGRNDLLGYAQMSCQKDCLTIENLKNDR